MWYKIKTRCGLRKRAPNVFKDPFIVFGLIKKGYKEATHFST